MVIQTEGQDSLRDSIAALMDKGQFGSNTDDPLASDGGVKTAIAATLLTLDSVTTSGNQIKAKHVVNTALANSTTFAEHEIRLTDTNSITRNSINPLNKTDQIEVQIFTIFTLNP